MATSESSELVPRTLLQSFVLSFQYVTRSLRRSTRTFAIGLTAVTVVVFFVTFLQNIIQQSPVIFFRLSEITTGELDLLLTPSPMINNNSIFVNGTLVAERIGRPINERRAAFDASVGAINFLPAFNVTRKDHPRVNGSLPRWLGLGTLVNRDFPILNASARVIALDTELEDALGVGRRWGFRPLGEREAHVDPSLLRAIGIRPERGERAVLRLDLVKLYQSVSGNTDEETAAVIGATLAGSGIDLGQVVSLLSLQAQLGPLIGALANATVPDNITLNAAALESLLEAVGVNGVSLPGDVTIPGATIRALQAQLRSNEGALLNPAGLNLTNLTEASLQAAIYSVLKTSLVITQEIAVAEALSGAQGRWPNSLGSVVCLDSRHLLVLLRGAIRQVFDGLRQLFGFAFTAATTAANVTEATFEAALSSVRLNDFALGAVVQNRDRLVSYVKTGSELKQDMVDFSNEAMALLGPGVAADPSLPVYVAIQATSIVRLFLDQLFLMVVVVLGFLGCLLIYQLVINDVEEKTYEYGMLRALGMRKRALIQLLAVQSAYFSLPGISVGLALAFLVCLYPTFFIAEYSRTVPSYGLRGLAVGVGVIVGTVIPVLSNIAPIKRALGKTLRDSLDVYHQVQNDVTVSFVRLANVGLDNWQVAIAIVLVVTGFTVYYMFPYAIIFNNLSLLLTLLLAILLGMVMGFVLLSQTLQPYLERGLLRCILLPPHRLLHTLIRQHMSAHRSRNSKAALMFTTSLAFLIFAGTMFALQAVTIPTNIRILLGSDIVVQSPKYELPLDEASMRKWLDAEMARPGSRVAGYAFRTFALTDWKGIVRSRISALAAFETYNLEVYGIDRTYLEGTYSDVFITTEVEDGAALNKTAGVPDPVKSLYDRPGSTAGETAFPDVGRPRPAELAVTGVNPWRIVYEAEEREPKPPPLPGEDPLPEPPTPLVISTAPLGSAYRSVIPCIVSESLRYPAGVDTGMPLLLRVDYHLRVFGTGVERWFGMNRLARARAMVRKVPGDYFTQYRFGAEISPVFISVPDFYELMKTASASIVSGPPTSQIEALRNFPSTPPKQKLFIRLKPNHQSTADREAVVNAMKAFITDDVTSVTDTIALVRSTKTASDMIILFFLVVGVITLFLAFFVLLAAFQGNVRSNSWEFGVLRSIGLRVTQLQISYIYEALSIVIASLILGTLIGIILAITLTLQFNVFLEAPFTFAFPTPLFLAMLIMSILSALLGSWLPCRHLSKIEIASVIRG